MAAQPLPQLSPDDYLELDRSSDCRHEFLDGWVYAMSGGSYAHAQISNNLARELGNALEDKPCQVLSENMRVEVSRKREYCYPDILVVCGAPRLADARSDTLLNPCLIAEVLSPSTERLDRGLKATRYRALDSVREYALVWQTEPRVEIFERQGDGEWKFREATGIDAVCQFRSVGCAIPLARIYRRVEFPEQPPFVDALPIIDE